MTEINSLVTMTWIYVHHSGSLYHVIKRFLSEKYILKHEVKNQRKPHPINLTYIFKHCF